MPVVLDASAILALLKDEPGADRVEQAMLYTSPNAGGYVALVSAVNMTEVYERIGTDELAKTRIGNLGLDVETVPYAGAQIVRTAALKAPTRHLGLSLADRACLALAQLGYDAVTADTVWNDAATLAGVSIIQIR